MKVVTGIRKSVIVILKPPGFARKRDVGGTIGLDGRASACIARGIPADKISALYGTRLSGFAHERVAAVDGVISVAVASEGTGGAGFIMACLSVNLADAQDYEPIKMVTCTHRSSLK